MYKNVRIRTKGVIQHVDALLQMMAALTHDKRFEEVSGTWEGDEITMSEILLDRIEERGVQKGIREGEEKKLIEQVCKKMAKGKLPGLIADELEEDEAKIQEIYDVALNYAPEYNCGKIFDEWKALNK